MRILYVPQCIKNIIFQIILRLILFSQKLNPFKSLLKRRHVEIAWLEKIHELNKLHSNL